jgi:hypothetical protein
MIDDQIARQMFDVTAKEVVGCLRMRCDEKYFRERLDLKLAFLDDVSLSSGRGLPDGEANVSFFMDDSERERVEVSVLYKVNNEEFLVQGKVSLGNNVYVCFPYIV